MFLFWHSTTADCKSASPWRQLNYEPKSRPPLPLFSYSQSPTSSSLCIFFVSHPPFIPFWQRWQTQYRCNNTSLFLSLPSRHHPSPPSHISWNASIASHLLTYLLSAPVDEQVKGNSSHHVDEEPAFEVVDGNTHRVAHHLVIGVHVCCPERRNTDYI